jgi:hypothetical protein
MSIRRFALHWNSRAGDGLLSVWWSGIGWIAMLGGVGWILLNGWLRKTVQTLGRGYSSAPPKPQGSV